ncbi:MAG: helix-turn-helix domain-containing protein [Lawsonibacter sp.]|nr:helix-turn-helix domain-containing protein [Lawsonibacter sp.]
MDLAERDDALYTAFKAKDTRFDGRFFVGISSTGVYCRPVCWARQAKRSSCTFFSSAAEAEQAGYRPCLLCRPELAPGNSLVDATSALARKAARLLDENCGNGQSLEQLAARLGCTDRHLRRVFLDEYHVTPVQYLQTCRLLLAKNLLTDTDLSVLEVAMAAGFGSLRRMNDLFQKQYKLSPTALRKRASEGKKHTGSITVTLGYRPPYRWEEMLEFLAGRAIQGVEKVEKGRYYRAVRLPDRTGKPCAGWVQVSRHPKKDGLNVTMSDTLIPVLSQILSRIRRLFDLYCDPDAVYAVLQVMDELQPGLCVKGRRVPGCFEPFETAVRAILGQQITVKAASTLARRMAAKLGTPVETGIDGLTCTFPTAADIIALGDSIQERLGTLGVIAARSTCIRALAEGLKRGEIQLDQSADPEREMEKLQAIRGIGGWTAQYVAMRTMGWPDAFLETDAGVKHALPDRSAKELLALAERWRPWRSYAVVNLWFKGE